MNKYTIYCTSEQTRKALELGAPIEYRRFITSEKYIIIINNDIRIIPTAEQMIGFLLDNNGITDIVISRKMNPHTFGFNVWYGMDGLIQEEIQYPTLKEATLAAINAALEYLISNKK